MSRTKTQEEVAAMALSYHLEMEEQDRKYHGARIAEICAAWGW